MKNFIDEEDLLAFIKNNSIGFGVSYPLEVVLEPELQVSISLSDLYQFIAMVQPKSEPVSARANV